MDIVLERVLSLIPKKADGKYVHGAKKEFADKLGLAHNLVTMWEKGQSSSYSGYLYEIAAKYDVSVEWLRGETDEKKPATPEGSELVSDKDMRLLTWFHSLPPEKQKAILQLSGGPEDLHD